MPSVATRPITHVVFDASGKPVQEIPFVRGDVVHDDDLLEALHKAGHHISLVPVPHNENHCPDNCKKVPGRSPQPIAPAFAVEPKAAEVKT